MTQRSLSLLLATLSLFGVSSLPTPARSLPFPHSSQLQIASRPSASATKFNRFVIGTLRTGEKVLRVPQEYMSQQPFKSAIGRPLRYSNEEQRRMGQDQGVFLWNGKKLQFTYYTVYSITDFQTKGKTYWLTETQDATGSGELIVSLPYFKNSKVIPTTELGYISKLRKEANRNASFIFKAVAGQDDSVVPTLTYRLNLSNPNRPTISRVYGGRRS